MLLKVVVSEDGKLLWRCKCVHWLWNLYEVFWMLSCVLCMHSWLQKLGVLKILCSFFVGGGERIEGRERKQVEM